MTVVEDSELARLDAAVPDNVRAVCERLQDAGFEALAVGGAVRDALLGRSPGDWDVASSALPDDVIGLFAHTIPTGIQHGTVTIVTGRGAHTHVEVTAFRGEGAYTDGRHPDHVSFGVPLVEDLARRDLRVNAMAYDPIEHELVDPFKGRDDLRDRVLRAVGPTGNVYEDAVARFTEDGLRVMRAVRFAAQLEFALDPDTERGIPPALPSFARVSRERISDELRKILGARRPSLALAIAERTGILAMILPGLAESFAAWGDAAGGAIAAWCVAADDAPPEARLAALVGEPSAALVGTLAPALPDGVDRLGRVTRGAAVSGADRRARVLAAYAAARGDAPRSGIPLAFETQLTRRLVRADAQRAEAALRALKFSNDEVRDASVLAGTCEATFHPRWTGPEVRRLLSDVTKVRAGAAADLWRAQGAIGLADAADGVLARGDAIGQGDLALAGKDLMDGLGLKPGPIIGRLLVALLERVLDDPALNTREGLLQLARSLNLEIGNL